LAIYVCLKILDVMKRRGGRRGQRRERGKRGRGGGWSLGCLMKESERK
jgi:hypothetical protein